MTSTTMTGQDFGNVDLPEGLGEKELRWSYWWINNRDKVKRAALGVLIGVDALLLGFGLWGFTDWLLISGVGEDRAIRVMASNAYGRLGGVAEAAELEIEEPMVFETPSGRVDMLSLVQNPNARYLAEVTYRFTVGGQETPERTTWVMPGQAKYLTELGWEPEEGGGGSVELRIVKRVWSRIDAHEVPDPQAYIENRFRFEPSNPVFTPAEPGSTVPVSRTDFTVRNASPYGYYDVDLLVLLYRGDTPVAASTYRVNRFPAGRAEPVQLFWYQPLPQVTRTEILADVNVFDPDAYLPAR